MTYKAGVLFEFAFKGRAMKSEALKLTVGTAGLDSASHQPCDPPSLKARPL